MNPLSSLISLFNRPKNFDFNIKGASPEDLLETASELEFVARELRKMAGDPNV